MKRIIPGLVGVLLALSACSDPPPESGMVTEKSWKAEYEVTIDGGSTCYARDKNGFCTLTMPNPPRYERRCIGGCYYLHLEDCVRNDKGENKCRRGKRQVPESEWNRYGVGTHYPNPQ